MTTTPSSPSPEPDDATSPEPSDAMSPEEMNEIAALAVPATVRRAPKYKSFFWVGAVVGIILGLWFGLWLSPDGMVNRWIYVTVTIFGTTLVTVLLAGAAAVWADRRSTRTRR